MIRQGRAKMSTLKLRPLEEERWLKGTSSSWGKAIQDDEKKALKSWSDRDAPKNKPNQGDSKGAAKPRSYADYKCRKCLEMGHIAKF